MSIRRRSLRWLLSSWIVLILVGTLLVLGAGIYFMVGRYLYRSGVIRLQTSALAGLNRYNDASVTDDTDEDKAARHPLTVGHDLEAQAPRMADAIGTRNLLARILNVDGAVLGESQRVHSPPPVDAAQVALLRSNFEERSKTTDAPYRRGQRPTVAYFDSSSGHRWQVVLMPLVHHGKLAGIVQVAQSCRDQEELLSVVGLYLLCGSVVAVFLGLGASYMLSRKIARPLEQLEATARRVADGDLSARAELGSGGHEVYAVAEAFDEMVEQLQSSFEAQRRFVADASHELKTPLTAIGGMAEMLRMGATEGSPEKRNRALDTIGREVDKMATLVNDLLMLSRGDAADAVPLDPVPVDLHALLDEASAYAQVGGREHRFSLENVDGIWVLGERDPLSRVVRNLLDNAFKYTPAGGNVTLRAYREAAGACIEIADSGIGISADDLPHVFDRFYRADSSRSRKTGGSGLGLAIVRAIVERHGGTVTLDSKIGKGTVARVRLPLADRR